NDPDAADVARSRRKGARGRFCDRTVRPVPGTRIYGQRRGRHHQRVDGLQEGKLPERRRIARRFRDRPVDERRRARQRSGDSGKATIVTHNPDSGRRARPGRMRAVIVRSAAASALLLAAATPSHAQSVADVLTFLVTNQSLQTGSFERDRDAAQATSETISRAVLANLATLPVTTSSGAFVYRLNSELGTVERGTQSFGPFFVERALTAGKHQSSVGLTFQHLRFTSLDGHNLRDGSLVTTANQFVDEATPFDVDRLTLSMDADIATLYGNLGLTDTIEIGFAAPMVALRLSGSRIDTYRGSQFTQAKATATAIGLADLVVRTKATVFNED